MNCPSLSDLSQNQLYLSKRGDVIDKVTSVIASPKLYCDGNAYMAVNILLNLAQCREAHVYLFQDDIVKNVIVSLYKRWASQERWFSMSLKIVK